MGQRNHSITVGTTTLDEFAAQNLWPIVVKVDVEGAEIFVLEGAEHLLLGDPPPTWIIEIHDKKSHEVVEGLLLSKGYQIEELVPSYPRQTPYPLHLLAVKGDHR